MNDDEKLFLNACKIGDLESVMNIFSKIFPKITCECYLMDGRNYAVKKGNLSIVKFLYENGVDINEEHNDTSPLMLAAQAGWVDITDFLISNNVDVNLHDMFGYTPLMIAVINGKIDIVTRLLGTGKCNTNYRNCDNDDALFLHFLEKIAL